MPTYGEVRTKFLSRLRRRDCTSTLADGFLSDSITRIQRELTVPSAEKSVQVAFTDEIYYDNMILAVPADLIRLKDITIIHANGETVLKRAPLTEVLTAVGDGSPLGSSTIYARRGAGWVIGPTPLSSEEVRIDYWSEYEAVSADADENILLDIADDLVVFGALSYAADHYEDKRAERFEARYQQILAAMQAMGDADELSGNAAVTLGYTYPDDF